MLSREENELLTRVGPGTPMGELMRRYWVPAVFSHQIERPDGPPVRVKLMGERLVAFRDSRGRVGLLDERCPHRTASMYFGRNEECGLRCVYHGWKFDVDGACVDLPSEPPGSNFQSKIRIKSYPCIERAGLVWTYMGPPAQRPEFPELEWTLVPPEQRFATRHIQECNWLQALEGGFDAAHLSFLHQGTGAANADLLPTLHEVVPADFGLFIGAGRETLDGDIRWASNLMILPYHKVFASTPNAGHMWVPIDDENTMLYSIDFFPDRVPTEQDLRKSKNWLHIHTQNVPGTDRAIQNRDNDYMIDRDLQSSGGSYTGLKGLAIQDCAIQESMGPIADRTIEHLGVSDTAIIRIRRLLLDSIRDHEAGRTPPGLDPASYRARSTRFMLKPGESYRKVVDSQLAELAG